MKSNACRELAVVVPASNEQRWIGGTLRALGEQTDRDFTLVVVDNASTDDTRGVVREFRRETSLDVRLVEEPEPGAGTAADTGFRYAIAHGARLLARTDADCLPARDWVATARAQLAAGAELVCGRSALRRDEHPSLLERAYPAVVRLCSVYGRWRPAHRAPAYKTPYVLIHGHNLALTADLYQRCGGTPREELAAGIEDLTLLNRARRHTDRIVRCEHLVVAASLRRLRAWGPWRTLLWHADRRYRPASVNVR
jgi:glycosyltransferase involved in cell wall biosynthesis